MFFLMILFSLFNFHRFSLSSYDKTIQGSAQMGTAFSLLAEAGAAKGEMAQTWEGNEALLSHRKLMQPKNRYKAEN